MGMDLEKREEVDFVSVLAVVLLVVVVVDVRIELKPPLDMSMPLLLGRDWFSLSKSTGRAGGAAVDFSGEALRERRRSARACACAKGDRVLLAKTTTRPGVLAFRGDRKLDLVGDC
jgi:hypothetical protein